MHASQQTDGEWWDKRVGTAFWTGLCLAWQCDLHSSSIFSAALTEGTPLEGSLVSLLLEPHGEYCQALLAFLLSKLKRCLGDGR